MAEGGSLMTLVLERYGLRHLEPVIRRRIMEGQEPETILRWVVAQAGDPPPVPPPSSPAR